MDTGVRRYDEKENTLNESLSVRFVSYLVAALPRWADAALTTRGQFHTFYQQLYPDLSGRNSAVECQLPKLDVAGSTPVARSKSSTQFQSHLVGAWLFLAKD